MSIPQGGHAEWGVGVPLGTIDRQLPCAHFTDRETEVQGREVAGGGETRHHDIALGQDHVSLSAPSQLLRPFAHFYIGPFAFPYTC